MKQILTIVGAIFLAYGAFSTVMHDTTLVGNLGKRLGEENLALFGYLAYVDFPLLFYPLYRFYRYPVLVRRVDGYVGWLLFFLSFVVLQPLLVGPLRSGRIGYELYSALFPYIGKAGLWLFWLMIFLLSLTLLIEEEWKVDRIFNAWEERFSKKRKEQKNSENSESFFFTSERTGTKNSVDMTDLINGLRRLFRNPFNHRIEEEVHEILSMDLPPLEAVVDENIPTKMTSREEVPSISKSKRISLNGRPKSESFLQERPSNKSTVSEEIGGGTIKTIDAMERSCREERRREKTGKQEEKLPEESKIKRRRERAFQDNESIQEKTKKTEHSQPKKSAPGSKSALVTEKLSQADKKRKIHKTVEIVEELEENSKLLAGIEKGKREKPKNFRLPSMDFLTQPPKVSRKINEVEIDRKIGELLDKLERFKIEGDVVRTYTGPLVTTFEFKPAPNVKVSKILGLQDDLAMALSAETIRIQAPIPGRDVVGIEIPNEEPSTIYLREILESDLFQKAKSPLTVALGKDIVGKPFVTDLKKLPHLLIAGTTGSGKSVGINAMLLSLLYRNDPDRLKLILIDPKMLEFSIYNDIPHLLTPVIIEPKKAISALANMVSEMERRYKLMSEVRVKNIDNYNEKARQEGWEEMPFIVIVIDELADLMMNGGKEVEYSIARLAQMARAAGIHLIVATQRPSVDVVTGLIKANLPSRLSYRVGQRIDSKVILDQMGAESLLGRGDALFTPPGATGLVRLHAPWNSEEEIEAVVEFLKAQREPHYDESYLSDGGKKAAKSNGDEEIELDPLFEEAKEIVLKEKKTSISYLQRRLQIGYNRSANLIDQLQQQGILSEPNAKGQREILV